MFSITTAVASNPKQDNQKSFMDEDLSSEKGDVFAEELAFAEEKVDNRRQFQRDKKIADTEVTDKTSDKSAKTTGIEIDKRNLSEADETVDDDLLLEQHDVKVDFESKEESDSINESESANDFLTFLQSSLATVTTLKSATYKGEEDTLDEQSSNDTNESIGQATSLGTHDSLDETVAQTQSLDKQAEAIASEVSNKKSADNQSEVKATNLDELVSKMEKSDKQETLSIASSNKDSQPQIKFAQLLNNEQAKEEANAKAIGLKVNELEKQLNSLSTEEQSKLKALLEEKLEQGTLTKEERLIARQIVNALNDAKNGNVTLSVKDFVSQSSAVKTTNENSQSENNSKSQPTAAASVTNLSTELTSDVEAVESIADSSLLGGGENVTVGSKVANVEDKAPSEKRQIEQLVSSNSQLSKGESKDVQGESKVAASAKSADKTTVENTFFKANEESVLQKQNVEQKLDVSKVKVDVLDETDVEQEENSAHQNVEETKGLAIVSAKTTEQPSSINRVMQTIAQLADPNSQIESAANKQFAMQVEQAQHTNHAQQAAQKVVVDPELLQAMNIARQDAAKELQNRVSMMLNLNNKEAEIRLDPPELGSMQIRIRSDAEQAQVNFVVQNQQAKELLEQSMPKLREMLAEQGINLGESSIEQGFAGNQGDGESMGQQGSNRSLSEQSEPQNVENLATKAKSSSSAIDYYA
ncbi:flagellar hook-length control protein FliK [Pseudoalteromonas xiamenensis]